MRLTVYSDRAVVEGRNFYTGEWLSNYVYTVSLKNAQAVSNGENMPAMLPETPVVTDDENEAA